ncbi:hypothetical protein ZWY2020_056901, partial [Hordeum vulgare]
MGLRLCLSPSRFSQAARRARGGAAGVVPRLRVVRCMAASDAAQLKSARDDIKEILKTTYCHPILVRLGWHDSGTYDKNIEEWPQRGGADGSLRFHPELSHGANAGLTNALKLIQPIKDKYPGITYADLFQLVSATAIEEADGPKLPMKYGRVDRIAPEQCPPEGRLPDFGPRIPAEHLRDVFYRLGLDDKVSGWGKPKTKYTVCSLIRSQNSKPKSLGPLGNLVWRFKWKKFRNKGTMGSLCNTKNSTSELETMLKDFITSQKSFIKSVEEKLEKLDSISLKVDNIAHD